MFPAHVLHHRNAPDVLEYFFFTDTATADIYTLSLHDALTLVILGTGERPLRFPSMIIQLHRLLKNRDGGGILTLVRKDCSQRSQSARVVRVELGGLLERAPRAGGVVEPNVEHAKQIEND